MSADSIYAPYHNVPKGINLLEKASRLGSCIACRRLGEKYFYGDFIEKNDKLAYDYLYKAVVDCEWDGSFDNGDLMEIYSIMWIIETEALHVKSLVASR